MGEPMTLTEWLDRCGWPALWSSHPFTLGYTGWRNADRGVVRADLDAILEVVGFMTLIVGYDPEKRQPSGGDRHAYEWAKSRHQTVDVETFPPPWDVPALEKSAGLVRDGAMVQRVCAAEFPRGYIAHLHPASRGAAQTAAYAAWRCLPVWERPAIVNASKTAGGR
ncbi:hypothetical protein AB0C10_15960 [Microbispora amethystogenes]|uniref:hypothetical protein n=1 Tax=Microbispora amethystogenes TaxID=1427754 RepID=UPI0033E9E01F